MPSAVAGCSLRYNGFASVDVLDGSVPPPPPPLPAPDGGNPVFVPPGTADAAPPVPDEGPGGDVPPPVPDAAATLDVASAVSPVAARVDVAPPDGDDGPAASTPGDSSPARDAAGTCPDDPALALCLRFESALVDESPTRASIAPSIVGFGDGPSGKAAQLGSLSEITLADSPAYYAPLVTIEAWVDARALSHDAFIVDHQGHYSLRVLADGTAVCSAGTSASAPGAVKVGVWTSLGCTFDGGNVALWINGMKASLVSRAGPVNEPGSSRLTVGWGGPPEWIFEGELDNIRLWRHLRTPEQLCAGAIGCP
jgi:hypothetical protein